MNRPPRVSLAFLLVVEAFFLFILTYGVCDKEIPVIFGHSIYGYASLATHPIWYFFGVTEWLAFSFFNGFIIFRNWKGNIQGIL